MDIKAVHHDSVSLPRRSWVFRGTSVTSKTSTLHRSPKEILSTGLGTEKQKWFSSLQTPQPTCGLRFSFLERGEFVERVPEERRLPLGLCQGKHLLLGDAGGHGDVALVKGVQVLVRWGHGASAVA